MARTARASRAGKARQAGIARRSSWSGAEERIADVQRGSGAVPLSVSAAGEKAVVIGREAR